MSSDKNLDDKIMKKLTTIATITLCTICITSCSTFKSFSRSDIMAIQPGMTKQEIMKKFGKPDFRSFDKDTEILEFNAGYVTSSEYYTMVKVRFENDKVVGMESYPLITKKKQFK